MGALSRQSSSVGAGDKAPDLSNVLDSAANGKPLFFDIYRDFALSVDVSRRQQPLVYDHSRSSSRFFHRNTHSFLAICYITA